MCKKIKLSGTIIFVYKKYIQQIPFKIKEQVSSFVMGVLEFEWTVMLEKEMY
jgi:hypothetical protein